MNRRLGELGCAIAIALLLVVLSIAGCAARTFPTASSQQLFRPLPSALTLYVPAVYDDYGRPLHADTDTAAGPRLWLTPGGAVSLTGVGFGKWCPNAGGMAGYNPTSIQSLSLNFVAHVAHGFTAGDVVTLTFAGQQRTTVIGVAGADPDTLDTLQVVHATATVTAVEDSILEGTARLSASCRTCSDTSLTTAFRLVHEHFARSY